MAHAIKRFENEQVAQDEALVAAIMADHVFTLPLVCFLFVAYAVSSSEYAEKHHSVRRYNSDKTR